MPDLTELHSQTAALALLGDLNETAIDADVPMMPDWSVPQSGLVTGSLQSEDDSALRALDAWRHLLGTHSVKSYLSGDGERRVWTVEGRPGGVSVWLLAIVPVTVQTMVTETGIAVAA